MVTRLSKSRYQSIASVNKMLDKYGHDCTVVVSNLFPTPVPAKVLFAKYDFTIQGGDLVLDANYKLLLKAVALPDMLQPTSIITVNGTDMQALTVKKLTPDGTNAIVWEVSAQGTVLPDDGTIITYSIGKPIVLSPSQNKSNYPSKASGTSYSIDCTGSQPQTSNVLFTTADWQISKLVDFSTIVASATTAGTSWTTGYSLKRNTSYYVRVRYNTGKGITSDWSDANLFSLDALVAPPAVKIKKPTIVTTKDASNIVDPSIVYPKYPWVTTGKYFPAIEASAYSPVTAGQFASIEWQVSTNTGFTSTIVNVVATDSTYVPDFGVIIPVTQLCVDTYPLSKGTTYYARVRYNSVDKFTSEWSDTFVFVANSTTNF
jgi:hypothetical protein